MRRWCRFFISCLFADCSFINESHLCGSQNSVSTDWCWFPVSMAHLMSKWQVLTILLCITAIGVFLRHPNSGMFSHDFQKPVANSCACGKCLSENDTWFIKRFNPSVRPFLAANCHLSKNTFNWWKVSCLNMQLLNRDVKCKHIPPSLGSQLCVSLCLFI